MACEVSTKDIKNRVRNQIKDKFDSSKFYSYTDRLVAFIPYDALNPSKSVLYGKVKKLGNQLNIEYGASLYGDIISFEQKPSGVEISINPPQQLADAMTLQNLQDEVGDDYYMGDDALREQEEKDINFSKRNSILKGGETKTKFQEIASFLEGKNDEKSLLDYANKNNYSFEIPENSFYSAGAESEVFIQGKKVIKAIKPTAYNNSWKDLMYAISIHNEIFPETKYRFLGFTDRNNELAMVLEQSFIGNSMQDPMDMEFIMDSIRDHESKTINPEKESKLDSKMLNKGFNREKQGSYINSSLNIKIEDLHDSNVLEHNDKVYVIDAQYRVLEDQQDFLSPKNYTNVKKPLTDNYIEYLNYKKSQLDKTRAVLKTLNRDKRNPKKDAVTILSQIKKLNITEAKLKQDIDMLEKNEVDLMFHAISSDIDVISNTLDNIQNISSNYDVKDIKNRIEFLYSFIKGVDLSNNDTDIESLKGFEHPDFAKISLAIDELNLKYKEKLSDMRNSILEEDISFVNNIKNNDSISEEELSNMFNSKNDINWLEKTFLGITGASNNDGILPQILKSFLETKVALREAEVKEYQDKLNKLVNKLKPGGFDFIFEKTDKGNKTGNIINVISPTFKKSLNKYFNIDSREDLDNQQKYKEKVQWLKNNTEVIDFRKLKVVKEQYGALWEDHFKFSEEEMDRYESFLKQTLGPIYEDEIEKVMNNLLIFQEQQATFMEDVNNPYKYRNSAKVNPWMFLDKYYSTDPNGTIDYNAGGINTESVYSDIQNIRFIPKKEVFVTIDMEGNEIYQDSGYYNHDFDTIQQDPDKLAYWRLMKEIYSDYINPLYGVEDMSYAKFEETFLETLASTKGLQKGTKGFQKAIHSFKELFYERGKDSEKDGVIKDYYDKANSEVNKLKKVLLQKEVSELREIAKKEKLDIIDLDKSSLVREIALKQVMGSYSQDINKVTGALLDMVAIQKAKEDTLPVAELILDSHKLVRDKKGKERKRSIERLDNWINRVVKNQNEKYRGADGFLGRDVADNTWFGNMLNRLGSTPFIKKYVNKKKAYLLSDNEKRILGYINELQEKGHSKSEETVFNIDDKNYQSKFTEEGLRYFEVDKEGKVTELKESEYEEKFQENLSNKSEEMGLDLSAAGFIQGILKMIIIKGLGLNPISGIFNRIEGKNSGIIMDQTGKFWTKGNIHKANNFMAFANFLKFLPERFTPTQLKKIQELEKMQILLNDLNLIQDRKNELERQAQKSKFDYSSYTNLYQFAVDNPEFKNQGSILLSILMDTNIQDIRGNNVPVFNGKEFSIYNNIDGKLVLKDEFRTPKNISNWENFDVDDINLENNQFLITRNKIKNAISRSQGNYDNLDVIDATRTIWGRMLTLFMKWMPEHFMQRFSSGEGIDLITGEPKLKGRYRYLWENHPALFTTGMASLALAFGMTPITAMLGAGFSGVVAYKYLKDTFGPNAIKEETNTALEFIEFTKSILVETLNYPLDILNTGKRFDNNTYAKSTLTQEEINNLQAISKELAIKLTMISLLLAVKKATWDDEDDKDSKQRQFHNFADNQLNRMVSALSNWTNPKALASDVQRLAFLRYLWDIGKTLESIATFDEKGKLEENLLKVSPLPRLLHKKTAPWLDEREYENAQWQDRLIKDLNSDNEWSAKQEYLKVRQDKRDELREKYKEMGLERDKLKKAIDKGMKKSFPTKKKGESYKSIMKRINNQKE